MFEKFTDRARKVIALANCEAQQLNCEYIGTEHILLGLIKEKEGKAVKILESQGYTLAQLRGELERLMKPVPAKVVTGRLPQTPRAKRVIEFSIESATSRKDEYVDTEHILDGLMQEDEGIAAQILMNLGFKKEYLEKGIIKLKDSLNKETDKTIPRYWMIPRDKMSLSEFLEKSGYSVAAQVIFSENNRIGVLYEDKEKLSVEYELDDLTQINKALTFRGFLDNNSIKYEESPPVSEVAGKLRESGENRISLADRLEKRD